MARAKILSVGRDGELTLHGSSGQGKFTDEQLLQVARMPNIRVVRSLATQPITKLPPFVAVEHLEIGALKQLESLAGLERMVTLRRLEWLCIEQYPDAMERMSELPELVELQINCYRLQRLPPGLAKLPSLISLELAHTGPGFDYADACKQIGASKTIRNVEILTHGRAKVPDVLAPLKRLEKLRLFCKLAPPSLWGLSHLRELMLCSHDRAVDLRKLTKLEKLDVDATKIEALDPTPLRALRSLRLPAAFRGELPPAFVEQLDELTGPARYAKQSVIPDEDTLHYGGREALPPSFGPVKELELELPITKPLAQLAECTQLTKLVLARDGIAHALPYVPKQLRSLEIRFQASLPKLPPLPQLTDLVIYQCKAARLDLRGLPKLQRLAVGTEVGALIGLDKLSLQRIEVTDLTVDLTKVPTLVEIHVMGKAKVTPPPGKWVTSKLHHGKLMTRG
jgi:hypothetical protein